MRDEGTGRLLTEGTGLPARQLGSSMESVRNVRRLVREMPAFNGTFTRGGKAEKIEDVAGHRKQLS